MSLRLYGLVLFVFFFCSFPIQPACSAPSTAETPSAEQAIPADGEAAIPHGQAVDPWKAEWDNQKQLLEEILQKTKELSDNVPAMVNTMNKMLAPCRLEMHQCTVVASTHSKDPRILEVMKSRLDKNAIKTREALAPVEESLDEVQDQREKIEQILKSVPKDNSLSKEMRSFVKNAETVFKQLNTLISRIESALLPGQDILARVTEASQTINGELPVLWSQRYMRGPQDYWSSGLWDSLEANWAQTKQRTNLRLPLELPYERTDIFLALFHAGLALLGGMVLSMALYRKIRPREQDAALRHVFRVSIPWLCLGIALLAASWGLDGNIWHLLMALGNMTLIVGQVSLAWDLRRMYSPQYNTASPMWQLVPLTLAGYVLIYPNLPSFLVNALWIVLVALFIAIVYFILPKREAPEPDNSLMRMQPFFLWICLLLAVLGLPIYSMVLYMLYLSITVALQLSLGSMQVIHHLSTKLPQTGIQAALGSLGIALAAPTILILVIAGMSLWVCTLPGGLLLVKHYAGASMGVGNTSFSFLSLLLIISVFYLTRAAVSLGDSFLNTLGKHGSERIDASLIPPLQTALTYAAWALFCLFVLRSLGLELSNLAMVAGGLSVGIGFGMQTIINNFLSGLILIFSRTLQEGDIIDVGGVTGTVRKISVRATMVETYDNAVIYVPNSEFVASRLINWTRNGRNVRREIVVGVAYGSDPQMVMKVMRDAASCAENVMKYPVPTVLFKDFGASTLDFMLRYWVRDFNLGAAVDSVIRLEMERRFKEQGIEVAFPQMDVHIKEMPPRAIPQPKIPNTKSVQKESFRPQATTALAEASGVVSPRQRSRRPARTALGRRQVPQLRDYVPILAHNTGDGEP